MDRLAGAACLDEAQVAQPGQVLRQRGGRKSDLFGEAADRHLAVQQVAERHQPLRVRQDGEQAGGRLGVGRHVGGGDVVSRRLHVEIFAHTNIYFHPSLKRRARWQKASSCERRSRPSRR
jgi:hypothetical protein